MFFQIVLILRPVGAKCTLVKRRAASNLVSFEAHDVLESLVAYTTLNRVVEAKESWMMLVEMSDEYRLAGAVETALIAVIRTTLWLATTFHVGIQIGVCIEGLAADYALVRHVDAAGEAFAQFHSLNLLG